MKGYKYLFKNIGFLTVSQFGTKLLSFFLLPLYTRVLSTTEYGTFDLITITVNLLIPIVTLNVGESILVFALDKKKDKSNILSIGLKYAIIGSLCTLLLVVINGIFDLSQSINEYWYYIPILTFLTVINTNLSYFARGIDKVKDTAISGILSSATMMFLNIAFLVFLKLGIQGYFLATIIGYCVQMLYLFWACKCWEYIKKPNDFELDNEMRSYSIPLIANSIGWWVNNSSDRYIVTLLCGVAENGIYSVGYKIPSILNMFQTIFSQAWTISAIKDYDSEDKFGFFSKMYSFYNMGMTLLCSSIIVLSRILAYFLYAEDFFVAWKFVPFLTISIIFGSLSGYLGGVFSAVKDTKIFAKSTLIGALTNIILNFILVYYYGAIGASIATAVGYFAVWLIRLNHVKKYIKIRINYIRDWTAYALLIIQSILLFLNNDGILLYTMELIIFLLICILHMNEINECIQAIRRKTISKLSVTK